MTQRNFKPNKTFEEIYAQTEADNGIVLFDTGPCERPLGGRWYQEFIFPAKDFSEIDSEALEKKLLCLGQFQHLILNSRSFTVLEVVFEMKRYSRILHEKLCNLNKLVEIKQRRKRHENGGYEDETEERNKDLFEEISFLQAKMCKFANQKAIKARNPAELARLEKIVGEVIRATGVKEKRRYAEYDGYLKHEDLKADDKLAATALYLALTERKANTILTSDSDIAFIINNVHYELSGLPNFAPRLELLKTHPIRVYYANGEDTGICQIDTTLSKIFVRRGIYTNAETPMT